MYTNIYITVIGLIAIAIVGINEASETREENEKHKFRSLIYFFLIYVFIFVGRILLSIDIRGGIEKSEKFLEESEGLDFILAIIGIGIAVFLLRRIYIRRKEKKSRERYEEEKAMQGNNIRFFDGDKNQYMYNEVEKDVIPPRQEYDADE